MAQGRGNAGIAAELYLSESSVEKHVNAIFTKLGLSAEQLSHRRVTGEMYRTRAPGNPAISTLLSQLVFASDAPMTASFARGMR